MIEDDNMGLTRFKIETQNGIYEITKPVERLGAKHFAIMTSAAPTTKTAPGEDVIMSAGDMERINAAFEKWASDILPHIIVSGPFEYKEMPGEDQYAIFMAVMSVSAPEGELFRIVD